MDNSLRLRMLRDKYADLGVMLSSVDEALRGMGLETASVIEE